MRKEKSFENLLAFQRIKNKQNQIIVRIDDLTSRIQFTIYIIDNYKMEKFNFKKNEII